MTAPKRAEEDGHRGAGTRIVPVPGEQGGQWGVGARPVPVRGQARRGGGQVLSGWAVGVTVLDGLAVRAAPEQVRWSPAGQSA
ncbi:hypothetical protein OG339_43260 [Streptosporangium sp. NBC_01495]|uniref:hypothetical protein n=1 Tax=Streptosporangium sp. NBC_01495 TaxID=2903899 RepID=UPI002E351BBE|nr:hypothetical protein [Streptosporangium sp. NBC_01495]